MGFVRWKILTFVAALVFAGSGLAEAQSNSAAETGAASDPKPCPEKDWADLPWGSPTLDRSVAGGMSSSRVGEAEGDRAYKATLGSSDRPLQITSKPIGRYTPAARENCIQGRVILKIRFLSDGSLGRISVKKGLPLGLTESAIASARQIRFLPELKDGKAISRTKLVAYNFTIY